MSILIKPKFTLGGISNLVHSVFFPGIKNPSILILYREDSLFLWNLRTDTLVASLSRISGKFKKILRADVCVNRGIKIVFIAVGFDTGYVQIWKIDVIKTVLVCTTFSGHNNSISCIKFKNNSFLVSSGCNNGDLVIWNISKGKGEFKIKNAHIGKIKIIIFLNLDRDENSYVFSYGNDSLIKIWKLKKNITSKIIYLPEKNISSIEISLKNNLLFLVTERSELSFYHISKGLDFSLLGKFWKNNKLNYTKIQLNKKESLLFLISKNNLLNIFIMRNVIDSNNLFTTKKNNKKIQKMMCKPISYLLEFEVFGIDLWENNFSNQIMVLIHYYNHKLQLYRFTSIVNSKEKPRCLFQKVGKFELDHHSSEVRDIIWFPNHSCILALCGISRTVHIWCLNSLRSIRKITTISHGLCLVLCGTKSLIVGSKTGCIEIYDILTRNLIWTQLDAHRGPIWSADVTQNQLLIVTAGGDGNLKIWEFETKQISLLKSLQLKEQILCVKLISKENIIVLCTLSSKISIFSLDNLYFSFFLQGHKLPVICLALKDDNQIIASGSADTSFRLWNLKEKFQIKTIWTYSTAVTAIAFKKHTGYIFTASRCGSIYYWEENKYNLLYGIRGCHKGPIWSLKSSINGKFVASGSQDKTIKIWQLYNFENERKRYTIHLKKSPQCQIVCHNDLKLNSSTNKDYFVNEIFAFLKNGCFSLTRKENKKIDWENFFKYFSKITNKGIENLIRNYSFNNKIKILLKLMKLFHDGRYINCFDIVDRFFFYFMAVRREAKQKIQKENLISIQKELRKVFINMDMEASVIMEILKSAEKFLHM
nr:WD repeat-containing protein 3 [Cryptomonas sp.]